MEQTILALLGVLAVGSALGVVFMPSSIASSLMLLLNLLTLSILFLLWVLNFLSKWQNKTYKKGEIGTLFIPMPVMKMLWPGI